MRRWRCRWQFRVASAISADASQNGSGFGPDLYGPVQHSYGEPRMRLVRCGDFVLPRSEAEICVGGGGGGSFGSLRPYRLVRIHVAADS